MYLKLILYRLLDILRYLKIFLSHLYQCFTLMEKCKIIIGSSSKIIFGLSKEIRGYGNIIEIGDCVTLISAQIRINGNNNRLIIHNNVRCGKMCSFWLEGNENTIEIFDNTTMELNVHLCAQEGKKIIIGKNCMFSNNIVVRTSDSHPIYYLNASDQSRRINNASSIIIEDNVWVCPGAVIMKGVHIKEGSIVASHSVVTHNIERNTLVGGIPAKNIKNDICWTRERLW